MDATIATISCTHSPFCSESTIDWVLHELSKLETSITHFVHLGDVFEANAASVHGSEYSHTLLDEYAHAAKLLARIRKELPRGVDLTICTGNHDDNIQAADPKRVPADLRQLVNWMDHPEFGQEFRRWEWLPYEKTRRCVKRVGNVLLQHGFMAGVNSDQNEAIQAINSCGGHSHTLVVRGHTHRPLPPTQIMKNPTIPLPFWCMNVGCLRDYDPPPAWMKRRDSSQWGHALGIIRCRNERPSRLSGVTWHAELIRR
tara:strand:+ start:162 stop:932 length:771 start_codon:yes stop_codon:yes gene_type:complete